MKLTKYRFWSPENKKMSESFDIKECLHTWDQGAFVHERNREGFFLENCIWLQFTGLLDKNGKEIYEGDIVKYKLPDDLFWIHEVNREKVGEVKYESELSGFRIEWGYSRHQHDEYIFESEYSTEVIGNIYDNQELLNT